MKKLIILLLMIWAVQLSAQNNSQLLNHYRAFYNQMKSQGDVQGVINALTHINVLQPSVATRDTLAVYYMNDNRFIQALNTIGIEKNVDDSDLAVEVKAVSLKALNQPEKALEHFEVLFKRAPNVMIAYEMADLKIQINNIDGARTNISFGIANSTPDMKKTYYDTQTPYQVPAKTAFEYLSAIVTYTENPETNGEAAIAILEKALAEAPNFNRAKITIDAIKSQINQAPKE
jgi:tetratricopeptide (TPR) repeat protein